VYDTSPAKDILGIDFINPRQSLIDMVKALLETGYITVPKE